VKIEKAIKDFFETNDVDIIGIAPEDIGFTIKKALSKIGYLDYGFSLDEANHIFTVVESFEKVLELKPDLLLLPYCSKDTECGFRHKKECPICGECTVGDAYEIGNEHMLNPITIVSFEDLIRTLLRYKKKGKTAFVGCCCEPFYIKHEHDFERAGLPGILINIDNTTCYELGEENRAYAGMFEKKTDLRVDLLKKVVNMVNNGKG
jgi:lipoate-protein ligase A